LPSGTPLKATPQRGRRLRPLRRCARRPPTGTSRPQLETPALSVFPGRPQGRKGKAGRGFPYLVPGKAKQNSKAPCRQGPGEGPRGRAGDMEHEPLLG
jgi:hypothetical protein